MSLSANANASPYIVADNATTWGQWNAHCLGERRPGAPNRMFDLVEHGFGASDWVFDPVELRSGGPVALVGVVLGRAPRHLLGRFGPPWGPPAAAEVRSTQWNVVAAPRVRRSSWGNAAPGAPKRMFDPVEHGFVASDWVFHPVEPRSGDPVVLVGVVLGRASRRLLSRFASRPFRAALGRQGRAPRSMFDRVEHPIRSPVAMFDRVEHPIWGPRAAFPQVERPTRGRRNKVPLGRARFCGHRGPPGQPKTA